MGTSPRLVICDTKEHMFKHFQESTWRLGAAEFVVLLSSFARSLRLVDARPEERPESAWGFSFEKFTHLEMSNLSMLLLLLDASIRDDHTFMDYGLIGWEKLEERSNRFLVGSDSRSQQSRPRNHARVKEKKGNQNAWTTSKSPRKNHSTRRRIRQSPTNQSPILQLGTGVGRNYFGPSVLLRTIFKHRPCVRLVDAQIQRAV